MTKAFVHVNGVTYELVYPLSDGAIQQLAEQLKPKRVTAKADSGLVQAFSAEEKPDLRVDVLIDGHRASLVVWLDRVWASAAWSIEDPGVPTT